VYGTLARVLADTAARHCPDWEREIDALPRVRIATKTQQWCDYVDRVADGTPLLLIDADTVILRPLDDVWTRDFDLAYTVRLRRRSKWRYNAGVLFLRVSDHVRRFMARWLAYERAYYDAGPATIRRTEAAFGSHDQAALHRAIRSEEGQALHRVALKCREWNCEDSEWGAFDPDLTRILHVKGALRETLFQVGRRKVTIRRKESLPRVLEAWRACAAQAGVTA
jgi:hypothetical protein